jgi:hypothetical protein
MGVRRHLRKREATGGTPRPSRGRRPFAFVGRDGAPSLNGSPIMFRRKNHSLGSGLLADCMAAMAKGLI